MLLDLENIKLIFLEVLNKTIISTYAPVDIDFTCANDFQFSMHYNKEKVTLRLTHKTEEIYSTTFSSEDRNINDRIGLENAIEYGLMLEEHDNSYASIYKNEIYFALRTFEKYGITFEHLMDSGDFNPEDVIKFHSKMKLPLPIRN